MDCPTARSHPTCPAHDRSRGPQPPFRESTHPLNERQTFLLILKLEQSFYFTEFGSGERSARWGEEAEGGDHARELEGDTDGDEAAEGVADQEDFGG